MPSDPPSISLDEVRHLAVLARIDLDDDHLARLVTELDVILAAVAQVAEVAGDDVPATSHPLPLTNVFRADEAKPGLEKKAALANAPRQANGLVMVTKVVE